MDSVSIKELGTQFVLECLKNYWGTIPFFLLFLVVLAYLSVRRKEETGLFLPYIFFLLLTIYNPFVVPLIGKVYDIDAIYYRFFWLLPVGILVCYLFVQGIWLFKNVVLRIIFFVLCCGFLVYAGVPIKNLPEDLQMPANKYRVQDSILFLCEAIHEKSPVESPRVIVPVDLHWQLRQYDGSIRLLITRENMLGYSRNQPRTTSSYETSEMLLDAINGSRMTDPEHFVYALAWTKTSFFVSRPDNPFHEDFLSFGYEYVGEYGGYDLYYTGNV